MNTVVDLFFQILVAVLTAVNPLLKTRLEKRRAKADFEAAFNRARVRFLKLPGPRSQEMSTLDRLLDGESQSSKEFAEEAIRSYLLKMPNPHSRLSRLYNRCSVPGMPRWSEFERPVSEFFNLLRQELQVKSNEYRQILASVATEKIAGTITESDQGPAIRTVPGKQKLSENEAKAAREHYCAQLAARCQKLEFLGILTGEEEKPIPLTEIFIPLQVREHMGKQRIFESGMRSQPERPTMQPPYPFIEGVKSVSRSIPITQALKETPRLVFLGPPGSGKSTFIRYLALVFSQGKNDDLIKISEELLPLVVPLRDYVERRSKASDGLSIEDYLYRDANENLNLELPDGFFNHYLEHGECIVLFDGLDEVRDLPEKKKVRDAVNLFVKKYQKEGNRFVITSRPAGYGEAPLPGDEYRHFDILEFSDVEIEKFVTKWYKLRERSEKEAETKKRRLLAAINDNPGVKRLAGSPLLLTIIALIHRQAAELPNQRVILYDKCTEVLLSSWERSKGLEWGIGPEEMRRRLEHIAFWMYQQGKVNAKRTVVVEGEELRRELARFLRERILNPAEADDEATKFLDLVQKRAGLLMETGRNLYSFVHLTFQEYFAAMDMVYRCYNELRFDVIQEVILGHLHEPAWREVGLLAISKLKPKQATKLLQEILVARTPYEDVLHRDLFFAARSLADDVEVDPKLATQILDRLKAVFDAADFSSLQADVLDTLGAFGGSRYASYAIKLVESVTGDKKTNPKLLIKCASSLMKLGKADGAISILRELAKDKDASVRVNAASTLGMLGKVDEAISILRELAKDKDASVRVNAASTLGKLGKVDEAIPILRELAKDKDASVRMLAASTLGMLGKVDEAIPILRELAKDENALVRMLTAFALGGLGKVDELISILRELAKDKDASARMLAASTLGTLGKVDEAIPILRELVKDKDAWVRVNAAFTLGTLGKVDEAIPILRELVKDKDALVRMFAASTLAELGRNDEGAIAVLVDLIHDREVDSFVRNQAYKSHKELLGGGELR